MSLAFNFFIIPHKIQCKNSVEKQQTNSFSLYKKAKYILEDERKKDSKRENTFHTTLHILSVVL